MGKFDHLAFARRWQITEKIAFLLGEASAHIHAISNTPIRPDYRQELHQVSLIKGAQATTAIEGNTLTFEQIQAIVEKKTPVKPSREYLKIEVENIIEALNGIGEEVLHKKKVAFITPELILNFHKLVGKNLGEHFDAIPGKFRTNNVVVGNYLPPPHEEVQNLVERLCSWLKVEFRYGSGQSFSDAILQAIVTHLYLVWIHPFSDGNGRTARLLEFYLLLRAGVPDIASHVLSNHYNLTRSDYYRQIENATHKRDLTDFIEYALLGFRDGLSDMLETIQENQQRITWQNYLYGIFDKKNLVGAASVANKRRRILAIALPTDRYVPENEIRLLSPRVFQEYQKFNERALERDLAELVELGIAEKTQEGYRGRIELLRSYMARTFLPPN